MVRPSKSAAAKVGDVVVIDLCERSVIENFVPVFTSCKVCTAITSKLFMITLLNELV